MIEVLSLKQQSCYNIEMYQINMYTSNFHNAICQI